MTAMQAAGERRNDVRYIVVGVEATLNGVSWQIVDISRCAVRLLRPRADQRCDRVVEIGFEMSGRGRRKACSFGVTGYLIRQTPLEVVYGYAPPIAGWESRLRSHDSFLQTKLEPL